MLTIRGFEVQTSLNGTGALQALGDEPDVILVDLILPDIGGLEILRRVKQTHPDIEVVIMTAHGDVDTAVEAVQAGAYHFLTKPFPNDDAVVQLLTKAAERRRLISRTRKLEEALQELGDENQLVGSSPAMQQVFRFIRTVAHSESTVLLQGESGTGKELVARAIHHLGQRQDGPFIPINCSAIPENLIESELFGHVRGAFTGAASARRGLFEAANGGTLFLDEVADLPPLAQVKLLRVLQEGEVRRVGSDETHRVDVRVVSASNTNLREAMEATRFREDLYYRLNVITIELPPLRRREGDIELLAHHFLNKYGGRAQRELKGFTPEALSMMQGYGWPGNVRELENAVERAVVLARNEFLRREDFPPTIMVDNLPPPTPQPMPGQDLAELPFREAKEKAVLRFESTYVSALLQRTKGNVSEAARAAGLDRSNFRRIIKRCNGEVE
jgi:DNA-binding NtrC family response regulator